MCKVGSVDFCYALPNRPVAGNGERNQDLGDQVAAEMDRRSAGRQDPSETYAPVGVTPEPRPSAPVERPLSGGGSSERVTPFAQKTPADCAHDRQILRHHGESKTPAGAGRRRFRGA